LAVFQQISDFHFITSVHFHLDFGATFAFWEADFSQSEGQENTQQIMQRFKP
jgi:hypothetical protein